jgi:translation initiation factor 2 alpha subunit (eIF-2alpha)
MQAVTTGHGVSGILTDKLEALVGALRNDTGEQGWHIYLQLVRAPVYSLRVYAPDRHSQMHELTMTANPSRDIGNILDNEVRLWQSRLRQASSATATD